MRNYVGAITGARIIEHRAVGAGVWAIELETSRPLPAYILARLETARGGLRIFKDVQAALDDVKAAGITAAKVDFSAAESFKTNRFEWMYEWIRGLDKLSCDEEKILGAFASYPGVRLNLDDEAAVRLGRIIIRHALGQSDGKELEAYLPPIRVIDVALFRKTDEGYFCQATCPNRQDDFTFFASLEVAEKQLRGAVFDSKSFLCKFALFATP